MTSLRTVLGLAIIGTGICVSFVHHAFVVPVFAAPLAVVLASFLPPALAMASAIPLVAFVHRGDLEATHLARAAMWYLGGAALFGVSVYVSFSTNIGGQGLSPDTWFSVANWTIGGSFVGLVVANYDLRRTRAIRQAKTNRRAADRMAQRLSVLNRVLRHDVRNKTNVVLGYAQLLEDTAADRDAVAAIENAARSLTEIADRARRVQSIVEEESPHPVDLTACLEELLVDWRDQYPDARLSADVADGATVETYPAIRIALAALLENAIEHDPRPESECELDVSVRWPPTQAGVVEVHIADNGPGIPDGEQIVFSDEPETQLGHSRGTSLWLTRWVVEESGGELTVDSAASTGTHIQIRLPEATG